MKKFTPKQVEKLPRKTLTADQFIKLANRLYPDMPISRQKVLMVGNGGFLGVYGNGKKYYRIHLKSIWIKPFTMKYSANNKIKEGKEIFISSFPLPKL